MAGLSVEPPNIEPPPKELRVLVGVTSGEMVHARFAHGFSAAVADLADYCKAFPIFVVNREISMARQMIVEKAIEKEMDVVVIVDDSVVLNPTALSRIVASEHPVTALNHLNQVKGSLIFSARRGVSPVPTRDSDTGHEMVDQVGLSFFQITLGSHFCDWFGRGRNLFHQIGRTPEKHFASEMRKAGHDLYIDHELSKRCGILGEWLLYSKHAEV